MTDTVLWFDINVVTMFCVVMRLDCHRFDLVTSVGMLARVFVMVYPYASMLAAGLMIPVVNLSSCLSQDAIDL